MNMTTTSVRGKIALFWSIEVEIDVPLDLLHLIASFGKQALIFDRYDSQNFEFSENGSVLRSTKTISILTTMRPDSIVLTASKVEPPWILDDKKVYSMSFEVLSLEALFVL